MTQGNNPLMGMTWPVGNSPVGGGAGPLWAPVSSMTVPVGPGGRFGDPVLSEMPTLPKPPFMDVPSPDLALPAGSAPIARSVPIASGSPMPPTSMNASAEIPPPHMAAPWVYTRIPRVPPPITTQSSALLPPLNGWPQGALPRMPQMGQPQPSQPQPAPPPAPEPEAIPRKSATSGGPTEKVDVSPLNDDVIRSLNRRLNDESEDIRSSASIDFFKILDRHPWLADDPVYKPYVDAFIQKIMNDTSPLVRTGAELAMQLGRVKDPPPAVRQQLEQMSVRRGPLDFEAGTASEIMAHLDGANTIRENRPAGASTTGRYKLTRGALPPEPDPVEAQTGGLQAKSLPADTRFAPPDAMAATGGTQTMPQGLAPSGASGGLPPDMAHMFDNGIPPEMLSMLPPEVQQQVKNMPPDMVKAMMEQGMQELAANPDMANMLAQGGLGMGSAVPDGGPGGMPPASVRPGIMQPPMGRPAPAGGRLNLVSPQRSMGGPVPSMQPVGAQPPPGYRLNMREGA